MPGGPALTAQSASHRPWIRRGSEVPRASLLGWRSNGRRRGGPRSGCTAQASGPCPHASRNAETPSSCGHTSLDSILVSPDPLDESCLRALDGLDMRTVNECGRRDRGVEPQVVRVRRNSSTGTAQERPLPIRRGASGDAGEREGWRIRIIGFMCDGLAAQTRAVILTGNHFHHGTRPTQGRETSCQPHEHRGMRTKCCSPSRRQKPSIP
jgi:hypothetical protein